MCLFSLVSKLYILLVYGNRFSRRTPSLHNLNHTYLHTSNHISSVLVRVRYAYSHPLTKLGKSHPNLHLYISTSTNPKPSSSLLVKWAQHLGGKQKIRYGRRTILHVRLCRGSRIRFGRARILRKILSWYVHAPIYTGVCEDGETWYKGEINIMLMLVVCLGVS